MKVLNLLLAWIDATRFRVIVSVICYFSVFCLPASAGSMEQAIRMHQRLTGVPPSSAVASQMANLIQSNQAEQAALIAMDSPYFYNVILKNWAKPMSNKDGLVLTPLNDMVATIIGMVRDNKPFDQVMYGDILYTGTDGLANVGVFATNNNTHYNDLERLNLDLKTVLTEKVQSQMNRVTDTAGILTSRGYGSAFMVAGTNRAVVRWAFKNFLCIDMEGLMDVTRPDYHVRRDVDRVPGGDSRTFKSQCVGCHGGLDSLAGAAAYFDFSNNEVVDNVGSVASKINAQVKFADGWVTTNDSWVNLWKDGQNSRLQWNGASSGNGLRSLGQMLSQTGEFNRCMAKRAFKQVCMRDPILDASKSNSEIALIQSLADKFKLSNYNMKTLFAATAAKCMGN